MRTTISIDDGLLADARRKALRTGLTVSGLIERALRAELARKEAVAKASPFRLVTFGGTGLRPGVSFDRLHEVADDEDREGVQKKGR
jgi:hypothetical protein